MTKNKEIQNKLTKNLLDLIILQILEEHPMHGYELMVTIRKSFGVSFGASTIYPLLNTMDKKNL
jgi:DNA-binding PadR family transcriptional regulator